VCFAGTSHVAAAKSVQGGVSLVPAVVLPPKFELNLKVRVTRGQSGFLFSQTAGFGQRIFSLYASSNIKAISLFYGDGERPRLNARARRVASVMHACTCIASVARPVNMSNCKNGHPAGRGACANLLGQLAKLQ